MEFSTTVIYSKQLAIYTIKSQDDQYFTAKLVKVSGRGEPRPPALIELHREGRKWYGSCEPGLVRDIGSDIENHLKGGKSIH